MMKYKVFQFTRESAESSSLKKNASHMILKRKNEMRKLFVMFVSICFVSLNAAVAHAQMTMDGSTTTDTTTDMMTDSEMDPAMDSSTETDATTVVDLIEGTDSETIMEPEPTEPTEDTGGGGGGGGGAILALVAVGAVAVVALNRGNKKPKIQKTFLSDQISGIGTQLIDISNQSSFLEKSAEPKFSFQYGSYQTVDALSQPYSFFNVRHNSSIGSALKLNADVGTRFFTDADSTIENSQWLTLSLFSESVFNLTDRLEFRVKYATGDIEKNSDTVLTQGSVLQGYYNLFSDQNSRFELAYSRILGQNQRLRFLLQKRSSSNDEYAAKFAWRYAF